MKNTLLDDLHTAKSWLEDLLNSSKNVITITLEKNPTYLSFASA